MSENTNNITTASVNELFSNSSLLRMNAIIPESASTCTAAVSVLGEKGVHVVGDSASRVCVEVRSSEINICHIVLKEGIMQWTGLDCCVGTVMIVWLFM